VNGKLKILLLSCLLTLALAVPGWGATLYVSASGSNTSPYDTWAKAATTISTAVAAVSAGDTIYVEGGQTYRELVDTSVAGGSGTEITIYFDATGTGTTRSRLPSHQAKVHGSVNLSSGYKWTRTADGSELISNPGFESFTGTADDETTDDFDNWGESAGGAGGYLDASTTCHAGTYSIKINRGAGVESLAYQSATMNLDQGYAVTFYGKSDGTGTGEVWLRFAYSGSFYYLQDDLTTWSTSENWIDDLAVLTSDTDFTKKEIHFYMASTGDSPETVQVRIKSSTNNGVVYFDAFNVRKSPNEYHLELAAGGDPSLSEPLGLWYESASDYFTALTNGSTLGALGDHEWKWGDNDTLGYNTIYLRDDTGDPDTVGWNMEAHQREAGLRLDENYYHIYGGIFRFAKYGIYVPAAEDLGHKIYYGRCEYNAHHGIQNFGDGTYTNYCLFVNNIQKGLNHHVTGGVPDNTKDMYVNNCVAHNNGTYGFCVYGLLHIRNSIAYDNVSYEFYKQIADPDRLIDPDEQYCDWYDSITGDRDWGRAGAEDLPALHETSKQVDPLFISPTTKDYRLRANSPCINAGTDVGLTEDFRGREIIDPPDIGAYQSRRVMVILDDGMILPSLQP
jgi:hypothetical protein